MAPSPSSNPNRILTYGQDRALLETRRMILEEAGFSVDIASDAKEFEAKVAQAKSPYGLYILCHTVPDPEQEAIRAAAERVDTAVYQLSTAVAPPCFLNRVSELLSASARPTFAG